MEPNEFTDLLGIGDDELRKWGLILSPSQEKEIDLELKTNIEPSTKWDLSPSQQQEILEQIDTDISFSPNGQLPNPILGEDLELKTNIVPSTKNWKGDHDFNICFGSQGSGDTLNKSASWTYSEMLDKLFVTVFKQCPIKITTNLKVPQDCRIRVLPVFAKAENISETVRRCPNHSGAGEIHNQDGNHDPYHLVRCTSTSWREYDNEYANRLSIVIPYLFPEAGADATEYLFQFMCYGSCVGGLNRKPLKLIFTLESSGGHVLGRRAIDLKICACPGRDRRSEEKVFHKKNGFKNNEISVEPPIGKRKREDDGCYIIKVEKKEHYDILKNMKTCLELSELVPSEKKEAYLKKEGMLGKSSLPQKPRIKKEVG